MKPKRSQKVVAALDQQRAQSSAAKATQQTTVSPDDLEEWREAEQQLSNAQSVYNFVSGRLIRKYNLTPSDEISLDDGKIARGVRGQGAQAETSTPTSEALK